jgi:hypothetical protein
VAHLWFNERSTVGDVVSYEERILALDRLIVIRIYDPGSRSMLRGDRISAACTDLRPYDNTLAL